MAPAEKQGWVLGELREPLRGTHPQSLADVLEVRYSPVMARRKLASAKRMLTTSWKTATQNGVTA